MKLPLVVVSFLVFFAYVCGMSDANANTYPCPSGCFCLGDGQLNLVMNNYFGGYSKDNVQGVKDWCKSPAKTHKYSPGTGGGVDLCNHISVSSDPSTNSTYSFDEFSEWYLGYFGFYGFKSGEFLYFATCPGDTATPYYTNSMIFECPEPYPNSDEGSKSLADCFKYDGSGKKVYYQIAGGGNSTGGQTSGGATSNNTSNTMKPNSGWIQGVVCQSGNYMPANSTSCKKCGANDNCPGGFFYTDIQYNVDRGIEKGKSGTSTMSKEKIEGQAVKQNQIKTGGIRKGGTVQIYR